jgi:NAD(P)-dependent dehydrogenase (short-subunit alcohol dehydrogenase family)
MKTILVTGASSGIGRAVAELALAEGWRVGLMARREAELHEVAAGHENALAIPGDVTRLADCEAAVAAVAARWGRLDALFNNAGIFTTPGTIDEIDPEDWLRAVQVNLTGMVWAARAAFAQMRRQSPQGGRIVNNGSISAHTPREGSVTYTTTKHGVTGLTKTLALDGRPFDIACGQVDIGNARTPMVAAMVERTVAAGKPAPEMMDVAEAARSVLFMAGMPLDANVLFMTVMATKMPYVGRG